MEAQVLLPLQFALEVAMDKVAMGVFPSGYRVGEGVFLLSSSHGEEHAKMRVGVQVVVVTPQQVQLRHARARTGEGISLVDDVVVGGEGGVDGG